MLIGFLQAFGSMALFGLYMVPRKFCGLRNLEFVLTLGCGVVATSGIVWALGGRPSALPPGSLFQAILCGPIWTFGMVSFTIAVAEMGLTLATPIKNTTAVLGSLIGLVGFGEVRHTQPILALSGSALIVLCAVVVGRTGEEAEGRHSLTPAGIFWSLSAAVCFAAYTWPLKIAMRLGLDTLTIVAVMALSIVASALVGLLLGGGSLVHWAKAPRKDHAFGALAGALWCGSTLLLNYAIGRIGLAVTWPITNLNTIVAVGLGVWVFHEVDAHRHRRTLLLGMLYATIGVVLLGLSKA